MLREVKNGAWAPRWTPLGRRYDFVVGAQAHRTSLSRARWLRLSVAQRGAPVHVVDVERLGRGYWWFEEAFYWEDERLEADDVLALVRDRQRRRRRRLEAARAALAVEERPERRREPIPTEVRRAVWERDGGRCVSCGADFELQFDHVIPHALGGAATAANLQLLCVACNQAKGATLG